MLTYDEKRIELINWFNIIQSEYPELKDTKFIFNKRLKKVLGQAKMSVVHADMRVESIKSSVIEIAEPYLYTRHINNLLDTVSHECAHVIANIRHLDNCGHDRRWQNLAVELGASPQPCTSVPLEEQPKGKYEGYCRHCDKVVEYYHRRVTRLRSCGICNPHTFDDRYLIQVRKCS